MMNLAKLMSGLGHSTVNQKKTVEDLELDLNVTGGLSQRQRKEA